MKLKRKKVLILTIKWGHYSIAKAIKGALSKDYETKIESVEVEKLSNLSYTAIYKLFPGLFRIPFKLSEADKVRKIANDYLDKAYFSTVSKTIQKHDPDIIVNVYFAFIPAIARLQKKDKHTFINVIADPRTFSRIEVTNKGLNLAFDQKAKKLCKTFGISSKNILVTGWFVRNEFRAQKQKKGSDDRLTFCVVGGSEGSYNITKILPAFLNTPRPIQVVFICGNNKPLLGAVKTFFKIAKASSKKSAKIIPLGYTKDIHKYLHKSDLVIGKAGPNLLFETVATKTPFFAISHIAGQEDGNLEIIKEYDLGYVEENSVKAIRLLRKIIRNPKKLNRFQKPLEEMANHNSKAPKILKEAIEKSLP